MKQLQKGLFTLSATTLLLLTTGAQAHGNYKGEAAAMPAPCPAIAVLHDGFYLGAAVGYDSYRLKRSYSDAFGVTSSSATDHANGEGWVGGLFGGYGMYFYDKFYLAAELFGNYSGADSSSNFTSTDAGITVTGNQHVHVHESYGISVLPGYKVNDATLAYVRLGYNRAKFDQEAQIAVTGVPTTKQSDSTNQGGFNYGVGVETVVYQNFSVRGEYTRTDFSTFTSGLGGKYKISDNQFMAGVIYHFV